MEIASIKGDNVILMYHPGEAAAEVGQQFMILETPDEEGKEDGLVVQVISNDSLEYPGLQQEMIQHVLEERVEQLTAPVARERGMQEIKSLKLAAAKIRKRLHQGEWLTWDGWIPTRNVVIRRVEADDLLRTVVPLAEHPIPSFARFDGTPIVFDGPRFNMVNVTTGVKGSGKSHLAKHLLLGLSRAEVPCIIFDINGEYASLPNAIALRWGDNFVPKLSEVGPNMLRMVVRILHPLLPGSSSESTFENRIPVFFSNRRAWCEQNGQPFEINIPFLRSQRWSSQDMVQDAIRDRLLTVQRRDLFWESDPPDSDTSDSDASDSETVVSSIEDTFESACKGSPIVFDMRELEPALQRALVRSVLSSIEDLCEAETTNGTGRYPFVFFEEAHFYIDESAILNVITRGRHIGMASMFVTNTPQKLPDTVFRQLDNLFLLALTHKDDIRNVSRNSFTDEATTESFATRMPARHAMVVGNVTDRYPLVLSVDPLPSGVPTTGRTRSTWDRLKKK